MPEAIARRLFDVDEYHRMAEAGILSDDDRVELIDGEIVAMTPIGPRHNAAVNRANKALIRSVGDHAIVQPQGPARLDRLREPQPDFVILRPQADFYASHIPSPSDILLVIEIADSSLDYDSGVKARIYAEAGLQEYWLVDLNAHTVSCFADPRESAYRSVVQRHRGESIAPKALPSCLVAVEDLLAD